MSLRTRFPASDVAELRAMQTRARSLLDPAGLEPGWNEDRVDVERVVEAFDLWVRDGYTLRVRHHVGPEGIRCLVDGVRDPDLPLDNPLEAVAGEPGAWPFLCASVLARELAALGTTGAHARWTKHVVCDGSLPTLPPEAWRHDPPDDARPLVIEDNNGTTVRFLTVRTDPTRVYRQDDRYPGDDFDAHARQILWAAEA